jgi:hypothetical protein
VRRLLILVSIVLTFVGAFVIALTVRDVVLHTSRDPIGTDIFFGLVGGILPLASGIVVALSQASGSATQPRLALLRWSFFLPAAIASYVLFALASTAADRALPTGAAWTQRGIALICSIISAFLFVVVGAFTAPRAMRAVAAALSTIVIVATAAFAAYGLVSGQRVSPLWWYLASQLLPIFAALLGLAACTRSNNALQRTRYARR